MSKFWYLYSIISLLLTITTANAQTNNTIISYERESSYGSPDDANLPLWVRKMYEKDPNVFEVERLFNAYYEKTPFVKNQHTQYYKRWKKNVAPFVNEQGLVRPPSKTFFDSLQNEFLARKANIAAAKSSAANWTCIGPFDFDKDAGGRSHAPGAAHVYTLEKSPSNPDILYCGTATAGVWKTTDRGVNWVCVTKNLPFGYCNAIEIHPTDPNTVWIGANNRLYKTTDGGANWSTIGDAAFNALSHSIDDVALQPNNANVLFVCSNKGLYRSTDGGANFTRIISSNQSNKAYFSEIEFKPDDPNTIYVLQSSVSDKYTEFYKSTDGGSTFTIMNGWPVIASTTSQYYQYVSTTSSNSGYINFTNDNLGSASVADFTIEMRVRIPNSITWKPFLCTKIWNSAESNGWALGARYTGDLTFVMGNGSSAVMLNSSGIWDNSWHHITVVWRSAGLKELYVDGVLKTSVSTAITAANSTSPMRTGRDANLNYGGFDIDIDDIRIWNTALSAATVTANMTTDITNVHADYANLLHYYKCNSIAGNIITDEMGTNNGTLTNTWTTGSVQSFASTTNLGSSDEQKRAEISVTAAKPNRVYALLAGKINGGIGLFGVYVSDDAGETWTHKCCGSGPGGAATAAAGGITTPSTNANMLGYSETGNEEGGQYYYDLAMDADPANGDKVHIGGINHWYSLDGGTTFNLTAKWSWPSDPEYIHADIHGIHIYGNEVWVNCDGGIFISSDSGKTNFNRRQYGIAGTDYWGFGMGHKDGDVMLGGTYHNSHLMKNGDVYLNGWVSYTGSADGTRGFVNPVKNKQVYNDSRRDILPDVRTQSPTELTLSKLPNTDPTSKIIWDPRCYNCIYTGKDADLWYSEDDGVTWSLVKNFGSMKVGDIEIAWDNPNIIWVTVANGFYDPKEIWKSTDRGTTWTNVTPSAATLGFNSSMWFDISLGDNSQDVWLATTHRYGWYRENTHKIFYSNNGGTTWTDWTTALIANEAVNEIAYQRGTNGGIYLGSSKSVFYRNKTMTDWVQFDNGLPAATSCVRLFPWYKEGKIRNATNRSVWESPLYEIGQPVAQPMVDKFTSNCNRDTFYFGDYSAHHKNGATFSWAFSPTPQYVSSTTVENPKVVFGAAGNYNVSLTVTDANGTSTKTVNNMVTLSNSSECDVSNVIGKAMSLSTNSDYLQTPSLNLNKNDGSNNNEITIMAWVRPIAGTQSSYAAIVSCASGINVNLNLRDNNELGLHWNDSQWWWSTGLTLPADRWSHVALVASASNLKIYLNGVAATNTLSVTALDFANRKWNIGRDRSTSSRTFKGLIDEVCFYNRALSQDELREKMHLIKDPSSDASLKGYFQFNETSGAVWNKSSLGSSTFVGAATRANSTAPVAIGTSQRMNITTSGVKDFTTQNLSIEFPSSGTLPNGEICVSALNAAPDQNPTTGTPLSNRYWIINNYGTNATFAALNSLTFNNLGNFAAGAAANLKLYKRTSSADGATWGTAVATATNVVTNNSVTFGSGNNITSFSQFALVNETVLSIEILDFQAILKNQKVDLHWKIGDEKDVNYYLVERSFDGKTFETLQQVAKNQWFTQDETPQYGVNYYRLKIVANDGKTVYSLIRSVSVVVEKKTPFQVFPNPTNSHLNIQFFAENAQSIDFELINSLGQVVHSYRLEGKAGPNHLLFNTRRFSAGQYILRITAGNLLSTQKIIIE